MFVNVSPKKYRTQKFSKENILNELNAISIQTGVSKVITNITRLAEILGLPEMTKRETFFLGGRKKVIDHKIGKEYYVGSGSLVLPNTHSFTITVYGNPYTVKLVEGGDLMVNQQQVAQAVSSPIEIIFRKGLLNIDQFQAERYYYLLLHPSCRRFNGFPEFVNHINHVGSKNKWYWLDSQSFNKSAFDTEEMRDAARNAVNRTLKKSQDKVRELARDLSKEFRHIIDADAPNARDVATNIKLFLKNADLNACEYTVEFCYGIKGERKMKIIEAIDLGILKRDEPRQKWTLEGKDFVEDAMGESADESLLNHLEKSGWKELDKSLERANNPVEEKVVVTEAQNQSQPKVEKTTPPSRG